MTMDEPSQERPSLLSVVQCLLERTYRMRSGIADPGSFVIGDRGLRRFFSLPGDASNRQMVNAASGAERGEGARILVRETEEGIRACVYYPDDLIERLEQFPPQRGVGEENVDAFATLVEELDHLLLLADRSRQHRPLTLFEMELHANVSKHLVLTRFAAGSRPRLDDATRHWLRHHLFDKVRFCDEDPRVRRRYSDAARWAVRLIDALPRIEVERRIETLRRFHHAGTAGKMELIRRIAA
jgi:hypothetical protein